MKNQLSLGFIPFPKNSGVGGAHITLPLALGLFLIEYDISLLEGITFVAGIVAALWSAGAAKAVVAQRVGITVAPGIAYPFGIVEPNVWEENARQHACSTGGAILLCGLAQPITAALGALFFYWVLESIGATVPLLSSTLTMLLYSFGAVSTLSLLPVAPLDGAYLLLPSWPGATADEKVARLIKSGQGFSLAILLASVLTAQLTLSLLTGYLVWFVFQFFFRTTARAALAKKTIREVMRLAERVDVVHHGSTVQGALSLVQRSFQEVFPVQHAQRVIGMVGRAELLQAAMSGKGIEYVTAIMERDFHSTDVDTPLESVISTDSSTATAPVIITDNEEFVGLINPRQVIETLLVAEYSEERPPEEDDFPL